MTNRTDRWGRAWARAADQPGRGAFSSIPGEQDLANELEGGRRHVMSGAGRRKFDVSSTNFLIDKKEMADSTKSHSLSRKTLDQLRSQALQEGRTPLYQVEVLLPDGTSQTWDLVPHDWVLEAEAMRAEYAALAAFATSTVGHVSRVDL